MSHLREPRAAPFVISDRPAGLVIGDRGQCTRMVRRNLDDPESPENPKEPCGYTSSWRTSDGLLWCERCRSVS